MLQGRSVFLLAVHQPCSVNEQDNIFISQLLTWQRGKFFYESSCAFTLANDKALF